MEMPYDRQPKSQVERQCAASCVVMVLGSLGIKADRTTTWKKIRQAQGQGFYAKTRRISDHLLQRNLNALGVRARDPFQMLKACERYGVHAIISLRVTEDSDFGHFVAFVAIDGEYVVVHDPDEGPNRRIHRDELMKLQTPLSLKSEIAPRTLILVSDSVSTFHSCTSCTERFASQIQCSRCKRKVALSFADVLKCSASQCNSRAWDIIVCPGCDAVLGAPG
jgi:ABC-type bacteriocin/lantibiotic exporter with double-glycine peptidase domain